MKIREILVLDEAVLDLDTGRLFYDEREFGVGDYFIDCLLSDIGSLKLYGGIHSVHFGYYRLMSKRFPFAVYYEIEGEVVRVIAILNMRMNPNSIRSSLIDRG
jgi:hypothetical protein